MDLTLFIDKINLALFIQWFVIGLFFFFILLFLLKWIIGKRIEKMKDKTPKDANPKQNEGVENGKY